MVINGLGGYGKVLCNDFEGYWSQLHANERPFPKPDPFWQCQFIVILQI